MHTSTLSGLLYLDCTHPTPFKNSQTHKRTHLAAQVLYLRACGRQCRLTVCCGTRLCIQLALQLCQAAGVLRCEALLTR